MTDRMQQLTLGQLDCLHGASMDILMNTGISFNSDRVTRLCKKHKIKTDGEKVFLTEKDILKALATAPAQFTIKARNPEKSVVIGEENYIFLPTGGAPNVVMPSGKQRPATMEDFCTCCKLVQTSQQLDMGGYLMVQPNDIQLETAHLDMLFDYITLCDKPIFGASGSGRAALDSIKMAGMIWGGEEKIKDAPILVSNVNAMSPLQYSNEQSEAIMMMAQWRQPVVISNMVMAGSTGPLSLPGLLALQNAEILAGMVLTQLVTPGTPVVYGSTSAPMDMKSMTPAVGAPETVIITSATAQLARYYKVPCRTGGMLADAHCADVQAIAEGTLLLSTAVRNGANLIYHAAGQMGSFISMGFEKWIMDEEVCAMVRRLFTPMEITAETIDIDTIKNVGVGGNYLTHLKTFEQFRNLYQPGLFIRKSYRKWIDSGAHSIFESATKALRKRLDEYQAPPMDPELKKEIQNFLTIQKNGKT